MVTTITKKLTKTILESIDKDKIVYAEVASPGAMGNSGGIILYVRQDNDAEMHYFESSIYEDEETYLLAEEMLFGPLESANNFSDIESLYFDWYSDGRGNTAFINKKVNLSVRESYFVYQEDDLEFLIAPSVLGVFYSVVYQMNAHNSAQSAS